MLTVALLGFALEGRAGDPGHILVLSGRCVPSLSARRLFDWAYSGLDGTTSTPALYCGRSAFEFAELARGALHAADEDELAVEHHALVALASRDAAELVRNWNTEACRGRVVRIDEALRSKQAGRDAAACDAATVMDRDMARPDEYALHLCVEALRRARDGKRGVCTDTPLVDFRKDHASDAGGHPCVWTAPWTALRSVMKRGRTGVDTRTSFGSLLRRARRNGVPFVRKAEGLTHTDWCKCLGRLEP
jgi:hypothetical protein